MNPRESRNAAAMRSGQAAYDFREPPEPQEIPEWALDQAHADLLEDYEADDITDRDVTRRALQILEDNR